MKTKRLMAVLAALVVSCMALTACGANDSTQEGGSSMGTSDSMSNPGMGDGSMLDDNARTGDIDGDGFIEDAVTDAENIVEDAVTGAESMIDDIMPNETDNSTVTTTISR